MGIEIRKLFSAVLVFSLLGGVSAFAQEDASSSDNALEAAGLTINEPDTLAELKEAIEQRKDVENQRHANLERQFENQVSEQERLLSDAESELEQEIQRNQQLDSQEELNNEEIANKQAEYAEKAGDLQELFGVLQQVAGETRGVFRASIVSAEFEGRDKPLSDLAQRMGSTTTLPSISELEDMWQSLYDHIYETGEVSSFAQDVTSNSGDTTETDLIRVGAFNVVSNDGYVNFNTETQGLNELSRQPSAEFANTAKRLSRAKPGDVVGFAVDATRGTLLDAETQKATLSEMVGTPFGGIADGQCYLPFCDGQGQIVGSVIILVGILGVILAVWRMVVLFFVGRKVNAQKKDLDNPSDNNPLGKLLQIYQDNKDVDSETLQLKMGEAILREMPLLTRNISLVQVISVVAPLMGLLGTVIGMILTFQAITLFGTGDPKIMAGGISTALMTTVLGLCVAIPTVLLHAFTSQFSRSVIHVLDEQSEGLIAQHAEKMGTPIT